MQLRLGLLVLSLEVAVGSAPWNSGAQNGAPPQIYSVAFAPWQGPAGEGYFITAGAKHLKFWTLSRDDGLPPGRGVRRGPIAYSSIYSIGPNVTPRTLFASPRPRGLRRTCIRVAITPDGRSQRRFLGNAPCTWHVFEF